MRTKEELHRRTLKRGLKPIEKLSVSDWADRYRVLPSESAEPGRWRSSRVPYMVDVMNAFTEPGVEKVVVKSAAQIGKSEVLLNVIGRFAQVDPATIMLIQPTLEMATDFSKSRLAQLIGETKPLKKLFYGVKDAADTRNANQTLLSKFYVGGRIVLAGANSPAGLASRPIRILLCDEVDRFPISAGSEGDPLSIASKRTTTYWNRKIGLFSTPTTEGLSRIDVEYALGTQEEWRHSCPNCGEFHTIAHHQINSALNWICPDCGHAFDELSMKRAPQKYVACNAGATGCRSFFVSGFSSSWISWREIMREWSEARGKPDLEKVVYNTRFGLSYQPTGALEEADGWLSRLEDYGAELPDGVLLLTAGVDVQQDRLEYEIVGWGVGEESWGIRRGKIYGSPNEDRTWLNLDLVLDREYIGRDRRLKVARTFVDSGFMTSTVYEYCRRTQGRYAIKGYGGVGKALIYKVVNQKGLTLTLLGVNEGKASVYNRLAVKERGAQYCHFGRDDVRLARSYDEAYFRQLNSERAVRRRSGGLMYATYEPVSTHVRTECLDCRVYALAALKSYRKIDWGSLTEPTVTAERRAKKIKAVSGEWT